MLSDRNMVADTGQPAIEMRGVSKAFGAVKALVDADLTIHAGSTHGLVGPNGAGKSTIIKVLAGILRPDNGTIRIGGNDCVRLTPASVEAMGVHFIHQDRLLVPTATVGEAIFLGHEPRIGPFINHRAMNRDAEALLKRYFDLELSAGTLVRELLIAQQKIVQITRALAHKARVPVLRRLRADGIAIIFISHYMSEIEEICDTVTVLRNGTDVGVVDPRKTTIEEIVAMMINRDMGKMYPPRTPRIGKPVLVVENLTLDGHF